MTCDDVIRSVLGALPETLLEDGRLPTFFTKSLTFLLSKGTQTPKLFVELLPFEEEQKRLESGSLADDDSPTVVASFLIAFFQQWQDPLLTFKLHNDFLLWSGACLHRDEHELNDHRDRKVGREEERGEIARILSPSQPQILPQIIHRIPTQLRRSDKVSHTM